MLAYTGRNNVTQIVMGKSKERLWRLITGRSLAQALLRRSGGAALHLVSAGAPDAERREEDVPDASSSPIRWSGYLGVVLLALAANGLAFVLDRYSTGADLAMIFLASVLVSGLAWGLRPALAAAALAILTYNFFFLEPRFSLVIGHPADVFTFAIFIAVAGVTGWLTGRVRDQARLSSSRAAAVTALLAASRRLSAAATQEETAQALAEQVAAAGGGRGVVMLPNKDGELLQLYGAPAIPLLTTGAMAGARWAWDKGEAAGTGTGTLPQVGWTFWPLMGLRGRAGVAGVETRTGAGGDEERLVAALLDQGAVALERAELAAATVENEALRRSDKLRAALLNSISHDLRTPPVHRAGIGDHPDRLWQDAEAGGARRPPDQHPRGSRASEPLCWRPAGHDPAGRAR